jgi:hypothetical protein
MIPQRVEFCCRGPCRCWSPLHIEERRGGVQRSDNSFTLDAGGAANSSHTDKSENIDFFAIGGTLVGSVRNGGLLSFDDDIDLGVLKNDVEKIKNYKSDVYFFEEARYGYLFRFKKPNKLFVDIMVFEQVNDQYKIINNNWENESLFINELKPLVPMIFSDVPIFVPNKYLQYMDRVFPNWQNEIRMDCGHHTDGKCLYETLKVPKTFSTDYEDSKYMCYSLLE